MSLLIFGYFLMLLCWDSHIQDDDVCSFYFIIFTILIPASSLICSVWVARRPPGYAFIEFDDRRDALDAIRALDGMLKLYTVLFLIFHCELLVLRSFSELLVCLFFNKIFISWREVVVI